jgi:hypothetical protein
VRLLALIAVFAAGVALAVAGCGGYGDDDRRGGGTGGTTTNAGYSHY